MTKKIEQKLYQNRYNVDEGRPHIRLKDPDNVSDGLKKLLTMCPAGCWNLAEDGKLNSSLDGCFECGTCRIVAAAFGDEIEWEYPRGGFGVLYKFG